MRKKLFALLWFFIALPFAQVNAQVTSETYAVEKTFAVNTLDTIYFALPPEYGWVGFNKTDTTTGFNSTTKPVAWRTKWNGNARLSIDLISGNAADSVRVANFSVSLYLVPGANAGSMTVNVMNNTNSLTYLVATDSTFSNVIGNGNSNALTITDTFDPCAAIGIPFTLGDVVGGSRRFRFALAVEY